MSDDATNDSDLPPLHLYSRGRRVVAVIVGVLLLLLLANLLIAGGLGWDNLRWAAWPLAIGWALYILQFRPEMVISERGVRMVNVLTRIVIPWNAVTDVRVKLNTEVQVGSKRYYSWGAPGISRRPKYLAADPRDRRMNQGPKRVPASDPTQDEINVYQAHFQPIESTAGREAVSVRWSAIKIVVTVLLVAFCVLSIVL